MTPRRAPNLGIGATPASTGIRSIQRCWYLYDWAISTYQTTTASLMLGPYLSTVARTAVCPSERGPCGELEILGIGLTPDTLPTFLATTATLLSSIVVFFVGAWADRSDHPVRQLGGYAMVGAGASAAMVFIAGSNWQLGAVLLVVAALAAGCSLVVYDSLLSRIAGPADRDRVSTAGWAYGYLGGGILLTVHLVLYAQGPTRLGISTGDAVRICLLTSGLWWAGFGAIAVRGLRHVGPSLARDRPAGSRGSVASRGSLFTELRASMIELRKYPQTARFLVAYLFYNDGVQTVIYTFALFGTHELLLPQEQLVLCLVLVQFVGFGGTLWFGRLAGRIGASRAIARSLVLWIAALGAVYLIPRGNFVGFAALSMAVGVTLGGTQALSRSAYSQLIPQGREAQFFGLYQALERATSWYGIFLFGVVYAASHSYRAAVLSTTGFFVIGAVVLRRVHFADGARDAGNVPPPVS